MLVNGFFPLTVLEDENTLEPSHGCLHCKLPSLHPFLCPKLVVGASEDELLLT